MLAGPESLELLGEGMFIPNRSIDKLRVSLLFSIAVLLGGRMEAI